MKKKVLLIRLDKIGDLICTMCVDQVSFLKDCDVQWVISQGLGFIPENAEPPRKYLELSKAQWQESLRILRRYLRDNKPDIAVSFQAPWWVNYALWIEKIHTRAGVQSQWHSFLFLNKGLRQRRSLATQHEADYNLDLLLHAFAINEETLQEKTPTLKLTAKDDPNLLEKYHLQVQKYVIVHPGMAGSALNWPIPHYIEFIEKAMSTYPIVLTGTAADEPWLKDIKAHFKNNSQVQCLQSLLSPTELFLVLKNAKAVVVPSTGVAHLAASLGTPVLGLYSPLRVQHPRRWAARGDSVKIFIPPTHDENQIDEDCMALIKPIELLNALAAI